MVEVPGRPAHRHPREPPVTRSGNPAILVEGSVSEHFEILYMTRARGPGIVKAVDHTHAFDWLLFHAIQLCRLGQMRRLQDGGGNVDDMVELRADATGVLDAVRP